MDIHNASLKASNAARHLAMAAACEMDAQRTHPWLRMAIEELTETANALGYVLVRSRYRSSPPQVEATPETEAA